MRIVAGHARGRRLATPAGATRPTSDRVREALFNTLAARVPLDGARVVDLFAGTGAVGLEALSRGAASAVFVESDRAALQVLRRNIATVGLAGARVVGSTVAGWLGAGAPDASNAGDGGVTGGDMTGGNGASGPDRFDIAYLDPPYAVSDATVTGLLERLAGRLDPDAIVVVERRVAFEPDAGQLRSLAADQQRRYGDTVLWYGRPR